MRNAETILGIIQNRGKRKLPVEDIYRQLFNRNLYLQAYGRIYRNQGAMTQGATEETVDAMSLEKIDNIIQQLRHERYRWTPVRCVKIPKSKQPGKIRTLGLPTWSDKLLQEVIRMVLEAYYEPQFSRYSHGFRPQRGCHTALSDIRKRWRGVKWFIEGDISACFDSIDHKILLSILRNKIHDNRFLRLLNNLFKAGYLEDWKFHITLSGVPAGGIVSPCLSNIYLNELDQFVESTLLPANNRGKRRKRNSQYDNMMAMSWHKKKRGEYKEATLLRQQAQQLPSFETHDPNYCRLWYIRYADDWLLGFIGPREEAETIKRQLTEFCTLQLKLQLSDEKTLITHARTQAARFLGYEYVTLHNDTYQHAHQRSLNGGIGLKVPTEIMNKKCAGYMKKGKPACITRRIDDSDYSITAQYQAEYRGFVQYYLMAFNVHRLWWLHYVMKHR